MSETTRGILLAYDGSIDADCALEWAASTAAREHLPVHALLVEDPDAVPMASLPAREGKWLRAKDAVELSLKEAGVTDTLIEVRRAGVLPAILEAAKHAGQVVLGSKGHGAVAETLVGSVSQAVAHRAPCPVVIVRPAAAPQADRIVVGIDGSSRSAAALEYACSRAEVTGEVVLAIHGWKVGQLVVDRRGNLPESVGPMLDDKELLLAEAVAGVKEAHPDVVLIQEPIPVAPGQALVDASRAASLVVTGSRGHSALTGVLLGSVSNYVMHHAVCPVAIVR